MLYSKDSFENTYAWKLQVLFQLNESEDADKFEIVRVNDLVVGSIRLRDVLQQLPEKSLKLTMD